MNQKKPNRTLSPPKDRQPSSDSKRGMFTSMQQQRQKPNVIPYLEDSLQGHHHYINEARLLNPQGHSNQSIRYVNSQVSGGAGQIGVARVQRPVTPTKVQFLYQGQTGHAGQMGQTIQTGQITQAGLLGSLGYSGGQQVQYVPIENRQETEVRRTIVPVHIINEIPWNLAQSQNTPTYQPHPSAPSQKNNDQAYQILLQQYQRLYEKLAKQQIHCQQLQTELTHLKSHQTHAQHAQHNESESQHHRKFTLNIKQLNNRLFKLYKKAIEEAIRKRKDDMREQMRGYFATAHREIAASSSQVVETVTKMRWKS